MQPQRHPLVLLTLVTFTFCFAAIPAISKQGGPSPAQRSEIPSLAALIRLCWCKPERFKASPAIRKRERCWKRHFRPWAGWNI